MCWYQVLSLPAHSKGEGRKIMEMALSYQTLASFLSYFIAVREKKKRGANVLNDQDDDVVCIDEVRGKERERGGGREKPAAKKSELNQLHQ